jgi:carboxypeptidase PM20D1
MKRALLRVVLAAALLLALLLGNALRVRPVPRGGPPKDPDPALHADTAAAHLSEAIRFRTVSHQDAAQDDEAQLEGLRAFLVRTYPKTHAALTREEIGGRGLLYAWKGSDPQLPPIALLAHGDVVPVAPGTDGAWTHPPFDGAVADGFVWGRGAIDDKGSLVAILEAVESLAARGFTPARTVYLSFGFDEEVGGREGAVRVAETLAQRGVRLAWVLDEGGAVTEGVMPGVARPLAGIAVAEKGYLSLELVATSEGGHSSMPHTPTAIGRLAAAIDRLETHPFPPRLVEPWRTALARVGPEMGLGSRVALGNLWLFSPLVARRLTASPSTNAWVRTTTAPTILEAGIKENVLPATARGVVNFRILPGDTTAGVAARVRAIVGDEHVTTKILERTLAEPARVSRVDADGFRVIAAAAQRAFPDALVIPTMVTGATDSRHFAAIADDIYRFVPTRMTPTDLPRFHGTNERVEIAGLAREIEAYREILETGSAAEPRAATR